MLSVRLYLNFHDSCDRIRLLSFRRPGVPGEYSQPGWQEVGNELRVLAERFSQCEERHRVRQRAESVDISSLKEESFFELLEELFQVNLCIIVSVAWIVSPMS